MPLAWELSQGQVVPYLSPHVPVTVPRRDRHMHFGPEFLPPNPARTKRIWQSCQSTSAFAGKADIA